MGGLRAEVPHILLGAVEPLTLRVPLLASGGQILIQPLMEKPKNSQTRSPCIPSDFADVERSY